MTLQTFYEELKSNLNISDLSLDESLGQGVFKQLILMADAQPLLIKQAQLNPIAAGTDYFEVKGKITLSALKNKQMEAVFRFQEKEEELFFELSLQDSESKTQTFTFADYLGPLAQSSLVKGGVYVRSDSVLSNLNLKNIRFTTNSSTVNQTLAFFLVADIFFPPQDEMWKPYAVLTADKSTVTGKVGLSSGYSMEDHREFSLTVPLLAELTNFLGNGKCRLELALEGSLPDRGVSVWDRRSAVFLSLHMQPNGFATPVEFSVPLFESKEYWPLQADFENGLGVSDIVNFFGSLFGTGETTKELMPRDTPLDFFKLYSLQVGTEFKKKDQASANLPSNYSFSVENMQAIFSITKPWALPIPNLTLSKLWVLWQITWASLSENQKRSYLMTGQVSGELTLQLGKKALTLDVTADLPSLDIEGHLVYSEDNDNADEAIHLSDLTDGLEANTPDTWHSDKKKLGQLHLNASPKNKSFTVSGELDDVLSFDVGGLNLNLENVHATVTISPTKKYVEIGGVIRFQYEDASEEDGFSLAMDASYDKQDGWLFWGGLSNGSIHIVQLLKALKIVQGDSKPDLPADFTLKQFDICFDGGGNQFSLMAESEGSWYIEALDKKLTIGGSILLQKDKVKKDAGKSLEKSTLSSETTWFAALMTYLDIGVFHVAVQVNDFFDKDKKTLLFQINYGDKYLQASYFTKKINETEHRILTLNLGGTTLGEIVETVMHMVNPNQKARLDGVWSVLNTIKLSDFSFVFDTTDEKASILYKVNLDIPGLMKIDEIGLQYSLHDKGKEKKLHYLITGDFLGKKYTPDQPLSWDVADGKPPEVQGENQVKFHLSYLGIGKHLKVREIDLKTRITDAIQFLKQSQSMEFPPLSYSQSNNWMFATDLLINDALHIQVALFDPMLYGLLITVDHNATSYLSTMKGLNLELLYKKVTEDISMFKAVLTLPERYCRLDIGVMTIILGTIGIEIYTNGDFLLDLGFPKNEDFSRSFSIEASGFVGHGGLLIGKLSNATCTTLPQTTQGTFHSVLSLGVGLALGLGKTINMGCVKGGATLEAFGIFEGILATFQPKMGKGEPSMYYRASATVGIIGRLFLTIDYKVISANFSTDIKSFAKVTMESYKPILIDVDLSLQVKGKAYVGIFTVDLSYNFHQHVSFELDNKTPGSPPWLSPNKDSALSRHMLNLSKPFPTGMISSHKIEIPMQISPLVSIENPIFTVHSNAKSSPHYCVALLPVLHSHASRELIKLLGKWLLQGITGVPYHDDLVITRNMAKEVPWDLANALTYEVLDTFLNNNLQFNIKLAWEEILSGNLLKDWYAVIPMPPPVQQEHKYDSGLNNNIIRYWKDTLVSGSYAQKVTDYFQNLNADPHYSPDESVNQLSSDNVPMAEIIFLDYIQMLYSELIKIMKSQFESYTFETNQLIEVCYEQGLELAKILEDNPQLKLEMTYLRFRNLTYVIQPGDTLNSIQSYLHVNGLEDMKTSCLHQPGLIRKGAVMMIETQTINLEGAVPWRLIAANIFVRYQGEQITKGYQRYITEILNLNASTGLTTDWVMTGHESFVISLPYQNTELKWSAFYGDTVVRLAKMLAVAQLTNDKMPEWDTHWEKFVMYNNFDISEGDKNTTFYTIEEKEIIIPNDMTLEEMWLRYGFRRNFSEKEWFWNNDILNPMTRLTLKNTIIKPTVETTIGEVFMGKNLSVDHIEVDPTKLAELVLDDLGILQPWQQITVRGIRFLTMSDFINLITQQDFVENLFGMGSRFLLQGLRVPIPTAMDETIPLYKFMCQQLKANPHEDFIVTMQAGQRDKSWVSFGRNGEIAEGKLIHSKLRELAPNQFIDVRAEPLIPLDNFREVKCYYPATSEILLRKTYPNLDQSIQMISKILTDAIYCKMDKNQEMNEKIAGSQMDLSNLIPKAEFQNQSIECDWGLLIPLEIAQSTGLEDVYQMYGANAADRLLLLELLRGLDAQVPSSKLQLELLYQPSPLQGLPASLTACSFSDKSFLVKTNLSVETHRTSVHSRMITEKDYQANLVEEDYQKFLWLIWECSTVGGGGYYLRLMHNGTPSLPENIFDENGKAKLWLLINCGSFIKPVNCALTLDTSRTTDSVMFYSNEITTCQPTLPVGCVGLHTRLYAPPEDKPDNYKNTRNLFSIVGYRIQENDDFKASNDSLPLVPTTAEGVMDDVWDYDPIVPLHQFVLDNTSQYAAVGKKAEISFEFRDILGNRAITNNWLVHVTPEYNDLLIGLHEWPGCTWDYQVKMINNKNYLELYCAVDLSTKVTQKTIDLLDRSRQQLKCPDVRILLCNQVLGLCAQYDGFNKIIAFADDLYTYMINKLAGKTTQPVQFFTLDVKLGELPECYLTQPRLLKTILSVERTSVLNDDLPAGAKRVDSLIRPYMEFTINKQPSLDRFATDLEKSYPNLRLALGDDVNDLYVVRFGENGFIRSLNIFPEEIYNDKTPEFYAIPPLSNEWITRKQTVTDLNENMSQLVGEKEEFFSDIDLEVWRDIFLADIERALDCDICTAAAQMEKDNALADLIDYKKQLAFILANELQSVRKDGISPSQDIKNLVADRFKRSLTDPHMELVAQYNCTLETNEEQPCRITTKNLVCRQEDTMQTSKISNIEGEKTFCVYTAASSEHQNFHGEISLQLCEIEYDISIITADGYQTSRWLQLIHPIDLSSGTVPCGIFIDTTTNIRWPNLLKRCPVAPLLISHDMLDLPSPTEVCMEDVLNWDYRVICRAKAYEQDTLHLRVKLKKDQLFLSSNGLFAAFAQYMHIHDQLWKILKNNKHENFNNAFNMFVKQVGEVVSAWNSQHQKVLAEETQMQESSIVVNSYDCSMQLTWGQDINREIDVTTLINKKHILPQFGDIVAPTACYSDSVTFPITRGQTVEIVLTIPKLSLLKQHFAQPTVWIDRNYNLFDSVHISVNPAFIYRSRELSWPAFTPYREYNNVIMMNKPVIIDHISMNMKELVNVLRESLLLYKDAKYDLFIVSLTAYFAYEMIKDNPMSEIRFPMSLVPDTKVGSNADESSDPFDILAEKMQTWCEKQTPEFTNASFYFDVLIRQGENNLSNELIEGTQLLHLSKVRILTLSK